MCESHLIYQLQYKDPVQLSYQFDRLGMSFGANPASTAARDAPIAAPKLSANSSNILKFSALLTHGRLK